MDKYQHDIHITDFFFLPNLMSLTSIVWKHGDKIDLCFRAGTRTAGRRWTSQGIVTKNTQYCSAALCTSNMSRPSVFEFVMWKGRRAKVIALAVIKILSSVWAILFICEEKETSNVLTYLLIDRYIPLLLLPIKQIKSFTAISASWRLSAVMLFHPFRSVRKTTRRIAKEVRTMISWPPVWDLLNSERINRQREISFCVWKAHTLLSSRVLVAKEQKFSFISGP